MIIRRHVRRMNWEQQHGSKTHPAPSFFHGGGLTQEDHTVTTITKKDFLKHRPDLYPANGRTYELRALSDEESLILTCTENLEAAFEFEDWDASMEAKILGEAYDPARI